VAEAPALFDAMRQLLRHRYGRLALLAAAAAALVIALSGGFRRAGAAGDALPVVEAGQPIESDAFSVTPLCAWASAVRPGQPASRTGTPRYLVLRARVVSKSRDWLAMGAYLDKDLIWLPAGKGDPVAPERSQRADDATLGPTLGPGLPVLVDFIWELPAGMAPPTGSTWGMFRRRHVERSYASGEAMWVQDGPGWTFELPVRASACKADAA